ncbi:hypothetical protein [Spiroplasma taiwanense]|uniref:Uncharacterized protein n=1 Tax=Spiroplasma taiwanense CT-1 TaxID=1276220 RepID=S5MBE7_9MOLU|nr:hypothetical protein [Spiroplasma taiwanense]AGR41093.1 hypothetical protein STAIW_v1c04470 [Spiroplasma taiwanense CT-1]
MGYNLLSREHYLWLVNISKNNNYDDIHEAMKIIKYQKKEAETLKEKWINTSKLSRNQYWILSSLLEKYKYNDILNALTNIFSK